MAEAQIAREAEEDVKADGEDAKDREALHQVRVARAKGCEDDRPGQHHDAEEHHESGVVALDFVDNGHGSVLHHAGLAHQAARTREQNDDGDEVDDHLV